MAVQLGWPIFLALTTQSSRWQLAVVALLIPVFLQTHPFAGALACLLAPLVLLVWYRKDRRFGLKPVMAVGLLILGIRRLLHIQPGYETALISMDPILVTLETVIMGLPGAALVSAYAAAICLLLPDLAGPARSQSLASKARAVQIVALAVTAGALLGWASDVAELYDTIGFRIWVLACSLPFFVAATIEALARHDPSKPPLRKAWKPRLRLAQACGAIFLLVLGLQSLQWSLLTNRFEQMLVQAGPGCIARESIDWLPTTPLKHWSSSPYSILLGGPSPQAVLLDEEWCLAARESDMVRIAEFDILYKTGNWFKLRDAINAP
jgi:hypothetical protein